jgi:hypothetical protein
MFVNSKACICAPQCSLASLNHLPCRCTLFQMETRGHPGMRQLQQGMLSSWHA